MNKRISGEEAREIYDKAEKLEDTFGEHFTGNLLLIIRPTTIMQNK
jgi:hypothetical protein